MPRTIYETRALRHPPQAPLVPPLWAYIGATITSYSSGSWKKVPVNNRLRTAWTLLNSDLNLVDYTIRDITFDSAVIDVGDPFNEEYRELELTVTKSGGGPVSTTYPDDTQTIPLRGLVYNVQYTVNLKAKLPDGSWTQDNIKTFRTLDNPPPLAPINLISPNRSNSWIDLSWGSGTGSSAVTYNVYVGYEGAPATISIRGTTNRTARINGLTPDRKYFYYVTGVNTNNLEGPPSNILRWATGHDERRNTGGFVRQPLYVHEFGSWRPDIGWNDWHYWPRRVAQDSIFQGFWTNDSRRYRGCVTYNQADFRHRMDVWYGPGVWQQLNVTRVEISRVYRMRQPGNAASQFMQWGLTNTNIFDSSGAPPVYFGHRNTYDNEDAVSAHDRMRAGSAIDNLRLPRGYGHALITGTGWYGPGNGVAVNGLVLHRGDGENNGYGTAGYGEWSGHFQRDRAYPHDAWRFSDWNLYITANWNFVTLAYQAPYQW